MITVLGSINLDLIAKTRRLPVPGETITGLAFLSAPGGKGANQALAARRAGAKVRMEGAVGGDEFAAAATALLRASGVDLSNLRVSSAPTGTALVLVDAQGENMITVVPGANAALTPGDAETAVAAMRSGEILMLQLETPLETVAAALRAARRAGVTSLLNIAPFVPEAAALANDADVVIANRLEFEALVGGVSNSASEFDAALRALQGKRGCTVITTLGADGVVAVHQGEVIRSPSLPITPVDTIGAGDTFCGYFAASLYHGLGFAPTLWRASVAAALACLHEGAQSSIPYAADVALRTAQSA